MSNPQYHVKYWKMPESWNSKGLTKKARFIPQTMANLVGGGGGGGGGAGEYGQPRQTYWVHLRGEGAPSE